MVFIDKTAELSASEAQEVRALCPYDIPRYDSVTGKLSKCTMCFERITTGMLPACIKACPTGTMNFGEREEMEALAQERLAIAKKIFPEAMLADPDDVNIIFLLTDQPDNYSYNAVASVSNSFLTRKGFLAKMVFDAFIDVYCCQQRFVRIKYRQGFIFIAIKTEHWVKIFFRTFSYRAKKRCNTEIGFPNYNISMVIDFVVRN